MQKIYYRALLLVYLAALVSCVGLQTFLRLYHIDPATGFYVGAGNLPAALNFILLAAVTSWFLMAFFHRTDNEFPVYRYRVLPRLLSALCGSVMLAYTGLMSIERLPGLGNAPRLDKISTVALIALGVLGGLGMVWFALRRRAGAPDILGIFPAIWQLTLLLEHYKRIPTLPAMSENLFLVLFMGFSAIFLLGQSRALCAYKPQNGRGYVIPSGLAASIFGFVLVVPAAAASLAGKETTILIEIPLAYWFFILAVSLYATIFLIDYIKSLKQV